MRGCTSPFVPVAGQLRGPPAAPSPMAGCAIDESVIFSGELLFSLFALRNSSYNGWEHGPVHNGKGINGNFMEGVTPFLAAPVCFHCSIRLGGGITCTKV